MTIDNSSDTDPKKEGDLKLNSSKTFLSVVKSFKVPVFEEHWILVVFKFIFLFILYFFFIEDILIKGSKDANSLLATASLKITVIIYMVLAATCILIGLVVGSSKNSLLSVIDFVSIAIIILVSLINDGLKYDLLPNKYDFKYLDMMWLIPAVSFITSVYNVRVKVPTKKSDSDGNSYIIPDLKLSDLATYTGEDIFAIDARVLNFTPAAQNIVEVIKVVKPHRAYSIGIEGEWGSGKSSLMDLIKALLRKESNLTVVEFNPWLYPDEKSLVANFFKTLSKSITNFYIHVLFQQYSKLATGINYSGININFSQFLQPESNIATLKYRIQNYFKNRTVKTIIIIDDLDRLDKDEILEISKLSRVVADFPNTIFLIAYSRNYIDCVIEGPYADSKGKYFDKIIQTEFKVPQATDSALKKYLVAELAIQLRNLKISNISENDIEIIISEIAMDRYLPTIRDVKLFLNKLLLNYNLVEGKVKFDTFFYFYLFEYKFKRSYDIMFKNRLELFLAIDKVRNSGSGFISDESIDYNSVFGNSFQDFSSADIILLNNLFIKSSEKSFPAHYNQYFISSNHNTLEYINVQQWYLNQNKSVIENWINQGYIDDLLLYSNELSKKNFSNGVSENSLHIILNGLTIIDECIKEYTAELGIIDENSKSISKYIDFIAGQLNNFPKSNVGTDEWDKFVGAIFELPTINDKLDLLEPKISHLNKLTIISDERTMFVASTLSIPHIQLNTPAFIGNSFSELWLKNSSLINELNGLSWITRSEKLRWEECDDGSNEFTFERKFISLSNSPLVKSAKLFILSDDEVDIYLNKNKISNRVGFDVESNPKLKKSIELKKDIKAGLNILAFKVKNNNLSDNIKNRSKLMQVRRTKTQCSYNPYGFIYRLNIEPVESV